jgi:dTDP-4-amino-4,6-dideoxygalactose transaminase
MQAAIGVAQLRKLPDWIAARRRNASILSAALENVPGVIVDRPPEQVGHAYYKYYARIDTEVHRAEGARDAIASAIASRGPFCGSGSCPEMYLEDAVRTSVFAPGERLPKARELGRSSIMFQCDQTLSAEAIAEIGAIAADVIGNWDRAKAAA